MQVTSVSSRPEGVVRCPYSASDLPGLSAAPASSLGQLAVADQSLDHDVVRLPCRSSYVWALSNDSKAAIGSGNTKPNRGSSCHRRQGLSATEQPSMQLLLSVAGERLEVYERCIPQCCVTLRMARQDENL